MGNLSCSHPLTMFKTKWGSHILPLIIPGALFDSLPSLPPNSFLLASMASLRTATLPEIKRMGKSLLARWAELDQDGAGALDSSLPSTVWSEFSAHSLITDENPPGILVKSPDVSSGSAFTIFSALTATKSWSRRPLKFHCCQLRMRMSWPSCCICYIQSDQAVCLSDT